MEASICLPNATYNTVVHGCFHNKYSEAIVYTVLIDGLSKNGHLENARSIFNNFPVKCVRSDVKTYTNKNYYEAGVLLDEMLGHRFAADASMASALLYLIEVHEPDAALLALRENLPWFKRLFQACDGGDYPLPYAIGEPTLGNLCPAGSCHNQRIYALLSWKLITGRRFVEQKIAGVDFQTGEKQKHGSAGRDKNAIRNLILDEAAIVFSTLSFSGSSLFSKLNCTFYVVIIDEAAQANLIRFKLIQPDVVTYNTIIHGICKRGSPSVAVKLFKIMEKKGCKPNTVTYTTIIDCLCKHRLVDQALGLLHPMTRKGISPDVITYSSLIQGLCDINRWHDVKQLLKEMDLRNISADVFTYNILIDAYCKEGMIEDAEDVIELMIQRGHYPDVVTYNSLVDGYCFQGEVDKALVVFESMTRKGYCMMLLAIISSSTGTVERRKWTEQ
ncbi:pentatricopeptide repeat-containing protein At5g39710-like [Daucus carota subsp. sativus]|uniref:pentatricopeptide repeat-containing protein At5g39710-like n=1 Tax=Daucus carota subsp. sativus TaxID=79200 RepID=UPI00308316A0